MASSIGFYHIPSALFFDHLASGAKESLDHFIWWNGFELQTQEYSQCEIRDGGNKLGFHHT